MPKPAEDKKKQEELEQKIVADKKRQAIVKEEAKKLREQQDRQHKQVLIELDEVEDESIQSLIYADYKKQFNRERDAQGRLVFESQAQAVAFFKGQAQLNRSFLASAMNEDNTPTGFHMFSCGDGQLYQGTLAEIKAQLDGALKSNPGHQQLQQGLDYIESKLELDKKPNFKVK